jgi:hypothetical protein
MLSKFAKLQDRENSRAPAKTKGLSDLAAGFPREYWFLLEFALLNRLPLPE